MLREPLCVSTVHSLTTATSASSTVSTFTQKRRPQHSSRVIGQSLFISQGCESSRSMCGVFALSEVKSPLKSTRFDLWLDLWLWVGFPTVWPIRGNLSFKRVLFIVRGPNWLSRWFMWSPKRNRSVTHFISLPVKETDFWYLSLFIIRILIE